MQHEHDINEINALMAQYAGELNNEFALPCNTCEARDRHPGLLYCRQCIRKTINHAKKRENEEGAILIASRQKSLAQKRREATQKRLAVAAKKVDRFVAVTDKQARQARITEAYVARLIEGDPVEEPMDDI